MRDTQLPKIPEIQLKKIRDSIRIPVKHVEPSIEDLEIRSHNICHPDKYWLDKMAKEYRIKFNNLLTDRGLTKNPWYK